MIYDVFGSMKLDDIVVEVYYNYWFIRCVEVIYDVLLFMTVSDVLVVDVGELYIVHESRMASHCLRRPFMEKLFKMAFMAKVV